VRFAEELRVRILPHWSWPDGGIGQVKSSDIVETTKGPIRQYFVWFDEELSDGSEDGPYAAGTVDEEFLVELTVWWKRWING
jgi:hypothetical protein